MSASFASPVATDSLVPGTELIVDRLVYGHHGVYLGDGLVIHYAGRTRYVRGFIEANPLQDFVGRRRVRLARKPESPSGEEIVRRACSRLGERRCDVFRNNREHFCSWCQFGESRSEQVDPIWQLIQPTQSAVHRLLADLLRPTLWQSRAIYGGRR